MVTSLGLRILLADLQPAASRAAEARRAVARLHREEAFVNRDRDTRLAHQLRADATAAVLDAPGPRYSGRGFRLFYWVRLDAIASEHSDRACMISTAFSRMCGCRRAAIGMARVGFREPKRKRPPNDRSTSS